MINRKNDLSAIQELLRSFPVVGIIGARQVGKSTLAQMIAKQWEGHTYFFDLEDPSSLARLSDPLLALENLTGLIIIDEIQRMPELFRILRVLADKKKSNTRFLVLGSSSPKLLKQSSESLAGRIFYYEMSGFTIADIGVKNIHNLWLKGGFPLSYLSKTHEKSFQWRNSFIKTFVEQDLPQLGIRVSSMTMKRFWTMLAHYHGQILNTSDFARSFGVADTTIRNYLDYLASSFAVHQLFPWHENIAKRQVKMPKAYILDSGILHTLLNLRTESDILSHPKVGASWESFSMDQIIRHIKAEKSDCYFWATHAGAELDLLIIRGKTRLGFEFKRTSSPKITSSMMSALKDLKLNSIDIIYPGKQTFSLSKTIRAVSLSRILQDISPLA